MRFDIFRFVPCTAGSMTRRKSFVGERRLEALDDGDRFVVGVVHAEYQLNRRRIVLSAERGEIPEEIAVRRRSAA